MRVVSVLSPKQHVFCCDQNGLLASKRSVLASFGSQRSKARTLRLRTCYFGDRTLSFRARRPRSTRYRERSGRSSGSPASVFSSPHKTGRSVPVEERKQSERERNPARLEKSTLR